MGSRMISAIVPCCNEYPQILFTVQSLLEEGVDEVVIVSNKSTDKTNAYFTNLRNPKVKFFIKDDVLSHWQAKNLGIEKSSGELLFFVDAHCIVSSLNYLVDFITDEMGAVHTVLNYMLDPRNLEYEFRPDSFSYRFCSAQDVARPYQVSVMSCCGSLMTRHVLNELGGWNPELGIYGGGEQYINWKQATCGYPQYIHPKAHVWHYAEQRNYSWNYDDFVRNQFIAAFCIGGEGWLDKLVKLRLKKDRANVIHSIREDVIQKCEGDRKFIKSKQAMSFDDYIEKWH